MMFVRFLAGAVKPALIGSTVVAAAAGGGIAFDRWQDNAATPFERARSANQQLVISEFSERADTIVAIDPSDPDARIEIAEIGHAEGYGVLATLSPDGKAVAYTALPVDSDDPSPAAPAIAGIVDSGGGVAVLADDADLLVIPVWSPDSRSIVVRKNMPAEEAAGTFELVLLDRDGSRSTLTTWRTAALFPIAFSPDGGTLYFATLNVDGSAIYRVAADGSDETLVAHLTGGIARDWRLSPDGATIAYAVAEPGVPGARTMTLDLATGAIEDASRSADVAINPAWRPDGALTIASLDGAGGDAVSIEGGAERAITKNDDSIDLPLSWSPDGATLAVRSVEGVTPQEARASRVELIAADGSRAPISEGPDVIIVGWLE